MKRHGCTFRCTSVGCLGPFFGFESTRNVDKYMKNKHPLDGQITFAKLKDSKPAVLKFQCEVCSSKFNQEASL
jgi:hypothetical protein